MNQSAKDNNLKFQSGSRAITDVCPAYLLRYYHVGDDTCYNLWTFNDVKYALYCIVMYCIVMYHGIVPYVCYTRASSHLSIFHREFPIDTLS